MLYVKLMEAITMAKQFKALNSDHRNFIQRQHIFFVSSATASSRVNISPREISALRIVDGHHVIGVKTSIGQKRLQRIIQTARR